MSHRIAWRSAMLGMLGMLGAVLVMGTSAQAATTLRGVVVHVNHRAHSFVVASSTGKLAAVHASRSPAVGSTVSVSAKLLRNGTFGAERVVAGARVRHARIRGVVTFVNRRRGQFTVSADGASLLVRPAHAARAAADSTPSVGADVSVAVEIDDQGDLSDQGVQQTGSQTTNIDLEGTILAIDPTARTLSISADDSEQSGQSLTVVVPSTIDITTFSVGDDVELTVTMQSDGTFLLAGSSGDANQQQADNQGDQQGCQEDGGDGSGSGGSSTCTATGGGDQGNSGATGGSGDASGD